MTTFKERWAELARYTRLYAAASRLKMPERPSEHLVALVDWFQDERGRPGQRRYLRGQLDVLLHESRLIAQRMASLEERDLRAGVTLHDH